MVLSVLALVVWRAAQGEWHGDLFLKTLLGGAVSEVTGDKFANRARSSAMAFIIQSAVQKIGAGGVSDASGSGNTDYSTEGTAEERLERVEQAKKIVGQNTKYKDYYAGQFKGESRIAFKTTDKDKFQAWIAEDPKIRTVLYGRHVNYGIFKTVTLYRSAVMGFEGSSSIP